MNRFQFSIIILFFSIFAASNGDLNFTFGYLTPERPACMDGMKLVYKNTKEQFVERFFTVNPTDQTPEEINECKTVTLRTITVNGNDQQLFEELAAKPTIAAIVTKEKLRKYMVDGLQPRDGELQIIIPFEDFGGVDDEKNMYSPVYVPPRSQSPASASTMPSNAEALTKKKECKGLPIWVYIIISVLAVFFIASFGGAIWQLYTNRKLRHQYKLLNKEKKAEPETEVTAATTTQMEKSVETKSKKKNRSKKNLKKHKSETKDTEE